MLAMYHKFLTHSHLAACATTATCSTSTFNSQSLQPIVGYEQGAISTDGVREYFYYIDHHGQLFLDDARMKNFTSCFKDKEFLAFFFARLRANKSDRFTSYFPYVSLCGPERNYVRCDDRPIVYSHIVQTTDTHIKTMKMRRSWQKEYQKLFGEEFERCEEIFEYNHAGTHLCVPFQPTQLCMLPSTGRVYYPTFNRYGDVGLVRSSVAIELAKLFIFGSDDQKPPIAITWQGREYELSNAMLKSDLVRDE